MKEREVNKERERGRRGHISRKGHVEEKKKEGVNSGTEKGKDRLCEKDRVIKKSEREEVDREREKNDMSGKGKVQKVREGQISAGECDKKRNWLREKKRKKMYVCRREIKSKNRKEKRPN